MELNEKNLENVLGGANPEVIDNNRRENSDIFRNEGLSEAELEKLYGGAPLADIDDIVLENRNLYRERSIAEIEKEKQELLKQREELLNSQRTK